MIKSKYNIFFDYEDRKIAFNAMTCGLAEVDDEFFSVYNSLDSISEDDSRQIVADMKKGGFILGDDSDELKILKYRNNRGKFNDSFFSLVIAPTIQCNFACPYCYETARPGMMSKEVQDKLVELVEQNASQKKNIDITWYGGEPLLAKSIIYDLSERFMEICSRYEVPYTAGIITNGYLFEEEDIEKFNKYRIRYAQITIDGTKEIHNTRRILKKTPEIGTFDKIIETVRMLNRSESRVVIRINVDKTNIENTNRLIEYLASPEVGIDKTKTNISFGHVKANTDNSSKVKSNCMSTKEYSVEVLELQKKLHDCGFCAQAYPHYPGIKANYCGADSICTFVIDHEGYKYKCWNEVGCIEQSVGNILWETTEYTDDMISRDIKYMTHYPWEREECRNCEVLPICMGGCPFDYVENHKLSCERWKYSLIDSLKVICLQRLSVANNA